MMQRAAVMLGVTTVQIDCPSADCEVVPGVRWGFVDAFPSPAYWAYQVLARRLEGTRISCRLGDTLKEETAACLLGGYGIPAQVGIAAFHHLKKLGVFASEAPPEALLSAYLLQPIMLGDRTVLYRFARQKAKYLAAAFRKLDSETPPMESGRALRNWLLEIPGMGLKTSSWVARNWLDADDVAIVDVHMMRAGVLGGFFRRGMTVERHYLQLEDQFLALSKGMGIRASELDAVIWWEMRSSGSTVRKLWGT